MAFLTRLMSVREGGRGVVGSLRGYTGAVKSTVSRWEERVAACRPVENWVFSFETGQATGIRTLDRTVFGAPMRPDIVHRLVVYLRAKMRTGMYKTKRRGEIEATSKKPFAQKGTGRARQGSTVGPHMRGGGKAHGPVLRSFAIKLPKKVRQMGFRVVLSSKHLQDELILLDSELSSTGKTKDFLEKSKRLGLKNALVVSGEPVDSLVQRASNNVKGVVVAPHFAISAYDILKCKQLVLTPSAVDAFQGRLSILSPPVKKSA